MHRTPSLSDPLKTAYLPKFDILCATIWEIIRGVPIPHPNNGLAILGLNYSANKCDLHIHKLNHANISSLTDYLQIYRALKFVVFQRVSLFVERVPKAQASSRWVQRHASPEIF